MHNPKINLFFLKEFVNVHAVNDKSRQKSFKQRTKQLVKNILKKEELKCSYINLVFCDDEKIRDINKKYLKHDYETDVLTFYDKDEDGLIESDVIVSVDTVLENSKRYKIRFEDELNRVVVHGVLHLCGYDDDTRSDKIKMRKKENFYLDLIATKTP